MMTVQYDPKVIYKFAERLYKQAASIAAKYALLGLLLCGGIGTGLVLIENAPVFLAVMFAGIGLIVGAIIGDEYGFKLRLQAQQALCQVKIEEHVRFAATVHAAGITAQPGSASVPLVQAASAYSAPLS